MVETKQSRQAAPREKTESVPPGKGWSDEVTTLLEEWCTRMRVAQHAYYAKSERLRVWNYLLGIPVVIVTAVVGTAVFASLSNGKAVSSGAKVFVGTVTILAAVLASIQTFTKLGESAQQHGISGDWYVAIRRDIEQILRLPAEFRPPAREYLDKIRKEMNEAAQKSPELGERWWMAYAQSLNLKDAPSVGTKRPWFIRTPIGTVAASQPPTSQPP